MVYPRIDTLEYNISIFGGEKSLIITQLSSVGTKNYTFGIVLIVACITEIIYASIRPIGQRHSDLR